MTTPPWPVDPHGRPAPAWPDGTPNYQAINWPTGKWPGDRGRAPVMPDGRPDPDWDPWGEGAIRDYTRWNWYGERPEPSWLKAWWDARPELQWYRSRTRFARWMIRDNIWSGLLVVFWAIAGFVRDSISDLVVSSFFLGLLLAEDVILATLYIVTRDPQK